MGNTIFDWLEEKKRASQAAAEQAQKNRQQNTPIGQHQARGQQMIQNMQNRKPTSPATTQNRPAQTRANRPPSPQPRAAQPVQRSLAQNQAIGRQMMEERQRANTAQPANPLQWAQNFVDQYIAPTDVTRAVNAQKPLQNPVNAWADAINPLQNITRFADNTAYMGQQNAAETAARRSVAQAGIDSLRAEMEKTKDPVKKFEILQQIQQIQIQNGFDLAGGTATPGFENFYNTEAGTALSDASQELTQKKQAATQYLLDNSSSNIEKELVQAGVSGANLVTDFALSRATGVPYGFMVGAQSGADYGRNALEEGYSADAAAARAAAGGLTSGGIESVAGVGGRLVKNPLGRFSNTIIGRIAGDAASEGLEEGAEYVAQNLLDRAILGKDNPIDIAEMGQNIRTGAIVGGVFGGVRAAGEGVDRARSRAAENAAEIQAVNAATHAALNNPQTLTGVNAYAAKKQELAAKVEQVQIQRLQEQASAQQQAEAQAQQQRAIVQAQAWASTQPPEVQQTVAQALQEGAPADVAVGLAQATQKQAEKAQLRQAIEWVKTQPAEAQDAFIAAIDQGAAPGIAVQMAQQATEQAGVESMKQVRQANPMAEIQNPYNAIPSAQESVQKWSIRYDSNKYQKYNNEAGNLTGKDVQGYVQAYIEQRLTKQNRRKLTRDQWLASAESLGLTMARNGMTDAQIEQAAYEIWMKYRPNQKESLNRQGKKYISFKMEDFFRAIENGANSRQEFSSRYSKPAEPAKIPEFNDPDVLDIPFGTIEYDGKTMDFYDYAQAKPNLSQTNAILSFDRIARKQDAQTAAMQEVKREAPEAINAIKTQQQKANTNEVIQKLQQSIPELQGEVPVANLTGNEFQRGQKKLSQQVGEFFRSLGNKVRREGFGDVLLDERGIKDDISHGIGRAKAVTFAAVPDVIANGQQIDFQKNWKGRGYDTYIFAAPVEIGERKSFVAAVVKSDNKNRIYLHEVIDGNGNVLYLKTKEGSLDIKTGLLANGELTGAQEPSSSSNIPTSAENVNSQNAESETSEAKDRVASVLVESKADKTRLTEAAKEAYRDFQRKFVDTGNEIARIEKITGDKKLYNIYNKTKQGRAAAEYMIGEGQLSRTGDQIGKGLVEIFDPVLKKGNEYTADFYSYLYHMHNIDRMSSVSVAQDNLLFFEAENPTFSKLSEEQVQELALEKGDNGTAAREYIELIRAAQTAEGKPVFGYNVTDQMSREKAAELANAHPEFVEMAKDVYKYNKNLMQIRVDSGLVSQEQADLMQKMYPHYVPTFRDVSGVAGSKANMGASEVAKTIKKATGGNSDLLPIHQSMARQTMQTIQAARRNELGQRLLEDSKKHDLTEFVQEQTAENVPYDIDAETVPDLENTFSFYNNGERVTMKVNRAIYEGLKELGRTDSSYGPIEKFATAGISLFKKAVTGYNPAFAIRNPVRDLQDAFLYSRNLGKFFKNYMTVVPTQMYNSINHPPVSAKLAPSWSRKLVNRLAALGMKSRNIDNMANKMENAVRGIENNSKMWRLYLSRGGYGSSYFDYNTGFDKKAFSKRNVVQRQFDRIEAVNFAVEQGPRFAEFLSVLENSGEKWGKWSEATLDDAMYAAADVTVNFGRSGSVSKKLNQTAVPFLNPAIQGFDKTVRTFKGEYGKGAIWRKSLLLLSKVAAFGIVPSVLNELIFWDDEEYESIPTRVKDAYYLIKLGPGQWYKIPKGRILSIFGSAAQRGMRGAFKGEKNSFEGYGEYVSSNVLPPNPLTDHILAPAIAVSTNRSWYGSPIEPAWMESLPVEERYDENTTELSKFISDKTNGAFGASPKKIDYLIDAWGGFVSDMAMPMMTPAAESSFFERNFAVDPVTQNKYPGMLYDTKSEIDQSANSQNTSPEEQSIQKNKAKFLNRQISAMSDISAEIRNIQNSNLSDKDKQEQIKEMRTISNTIAKNALDQLPAFEQALRDSGTGNQELDYLIANKQMFGVDYALQAYNRQSYDSQVAKGADLTQYYNELVSKKTEELGVQKEEKAKSADILPSAANENEVDIQQLYNNVMAAKGEVPAGTPISSTEKSPSASPSTATIIPEAAGYSVPKYRGETLEHISAAGVSAQDWAYVEDRLPGADNKVEQLQEWGFTGPQLQGLVEYQVMGETAKAKLLNATEIGIDRETYLDGYVFGYTTKGTKAQRNEQIAGYVDKLKLTDEQKSQLYNWLKVSKGSGEYSGGSSGKRSSGRRSSGRRSSSGKSGSKKTAKKGSAEDDAGAAFTKFAKAAKNAPQVESKLKLSQGEEFIRYAMSQKNKQTEQPETPGRYSAFYQALLKNAMKKGK